MCYNIIGDNMTTGYELTTAITNIIIFLVSIYCLLKAKKDWKLFYILMAIDSFLGAIVHGIKMSITINNILWVILSILFAITINTLLQIFMHIKTKYSIFLSIAIITILLIQLFLDMNFIITFISYVGIIFLLIIYYILKNNYKNKYYFLTGIIIQIIGGIPLFIKFELNYLNHNGICHLFTVITLILFYIGIQKEN